MAEAYRSLRPWVTADFYDFANHIPVPNSVYVVGRLQTVENQEKFRAMANDPQYLMIFANSAEGSDTLISNIRVLNIEDLVLEKKVLLIAGGDMSNEYPHVLHEHFLSKIFDFEENLQAMPAIDGIFAKTQKPYKFLFLNGRARPHRKYIIERFKQEQILDQSLWTMLDNRPTVVRQFALMDDQVNLMATTSEIKTLPKHYEVPMYQNASIGTIDPKRAFIKPELFNNEWGEIYLQPAPYIDTYFSLVTETVFHYPYSFRTEKIAKPLMIGHPWICASSPGFYRDIRNLGFKTFDALIDESFDTIDNHQERMERIVQVVKDLCNQDLPAFLAAAQDICKYNQQRALELSSKITREFPEKFFNFVNKHTQ